ncbi:uncharacterized protein EV154DRAFT_480353 [Mucor mucedo]|uniref:uncharacterized protein n=1 Tax=Mucor mucedo TaxID=29922 RepID=UPI00221FACC8|nr:uncharacterized protein EV154DRAFT_480353 [Mucor mucedo]KAI7892406.1 hypothetical protein EV154DRAFT_480353 [Mucor mucedo]
MRQEYPDNISESDYTDQIWPPIFKSLFAINRLYQQILQSKTGIRFIFDCKESEFDIGGAEVYLPDADITKLTDDEAKLLREGKSIDNSLNSVSYGDICFSWIVQISVLRAYFSTVANVGHGLHVGILQNQILFPSCIGELNNATKSLAFFKTLFQFENGIEDSAHIIQSNISQTNKWNNATSDRFSDPGLAPLPRTMQHLLSQTCISPHYNLQMLETGSDTLIEDSILDSPFPSVTDNNELTTEDSFGFPTFEPDNDVDGIGAKLLLDDTLMVLTEAQVIVIELTE